MSPKDDSQKLLLAGYENGNQIYWKKNKFIEEQKLSSQSSGKGAKRTHALAVNTHRCIGKAFKGLTLCEQHHDAAATE